MPNRRAQLTTEKRADVVLAISRARADLDRGLARLESLAHDDVQRFSYSVHALHNYLMVVSTTLQLLRSKLAPRGDRDVRRWLDSLKQATSLMMSTARGVLTATPDVLPPLLLEDASLSDIAASVCQSYGDIADRKGIRIIWRPSLEPEHVVTDRVAAGAVLDNLLSNAVKYSAGKSTVSVSMSVEEGRVTCAIRDRGPGLSENDQAKLYQRGVCLSAQPTAGEPSTGYGLAIAKDLATALNGRLSCNSTLGEGACFKFSLPIAGSDIPLPTIPAALGQSVGAAIA